MKKMMLIGSLAILLSTFTTGCQESDDCPAPEVTISKTVWTMEYNEGSSGNHRYYAPGSFIAGGVATFAANLPHASQWFSQYTLPVPQEVELDLDADDVKLVARIKNPSGDGVAQEIDLGLNYGTSFAGASWQKSIPVFCKMTVGSQTISNVTELLTDPTNFADYAIGLSGNNLTAYKNDVALKTFPYTGSTGILTSINIAFRGYGTIEWVKLYKGTTLIMSEEFDVNGQTHAVWTLP